MSNFYQFTMPDITGEMVSMEQYKDQVVLVVNTASKCGFTPQYAGLDALYDSYKDKGFVVLGFPCNQFGAQEPGSHEDIAEFCEIRFGVSFPLFEKVDVNGANAAPLYEHLKREAPGVLGSRSIKWNFTKFLIDRKGKVVARYGSATKPEQIEADIQVQLG